MARSIPPIDGLLQNGPGGARRGPARGGASHWTRDSAMLMAGQMRPPLSSSQSPLSSVSACGENCARSLAPPLPTARGAVGAPHKDIKKKMRRARWKRKNVRRVGLRQRRPPAAGGGWLVVPCGGQGRKRPALGEPFGPGKSGIPFAPIFAAAGQWLMKASA